MFFGRIIKLVAAIVVAGGVWAVDSARPASASDLSANRPSSNRWPDGQGSPSDIRRRVSEPAQDPVCPECAIRFDTVATFGSLDDADWFPEEPRTMARDGLGRLYLAFPNLGQLLVFDSAGGALPPIGRRGEGPGEYQLPYLVRIARSDSVAVFDYAGQLSLLGPAGELAMRSGPVRLGMVMDLLVTGDGTVVFSSISGFSGGSSGEKPVVGVFSVYDMRESVITRSFESPGATVPAQDDGRFYMGASRHPDRFWATPTGRYEMVEYGVDGTVARRVARDPAWMRVRPPEDGNVPPLSAIRGLTEWDGQLWTVGRSVGDDWVRYFNHEAFERWEGGGAPVDYSTFMRSIVEVVDIDTGRLVTSAYMPGLVLALFPDLHVASYREDEAGVPFITVFRMSLAGRPEEGGLSEHRPR